MWKRTHRVVGSFELAPQSRQTTATERLLSPGIRTKKDKHFERNISMVITDFTYTFFCSLTRSGKLQIHSYQYLKPVMISDTKQNYHIAETMHLLSNCHQELSGSSSSTMLMSSCHKTVSKRSSSCSQVGLLLSSQSTFVTLT